MHQTTSILVASFSLATSLSAAFVLDNTSSATATLVLPGSSSSLATGYRGYSFEVGSTAYTLSSVTFGVYANSVGQGNVGVRLYAADASGLPTGDPLETITPTLHDLTTIALGGTYHTWNVSWSLEANTRYAVAAIYASGGTQTPRLAVPSGGPSPTLAAGFTAGTFFANTTSTSDHYAVLFQGTPVPEPATYGIVFGCLSFLGVVIRRREAA